MPRPKKSIYERIKQADDDILACEQKLIQLKELKQKLLDEKEEFEKQNLIDLIKKNNLKYEDVEKLIIKSQKNKS